MRESTSCGIGSLLALLFVELSDEVPNLLFGVGPDAAATP
ncbi:exported hypothetical protein [Agrobacterium tomkonis CFBP 6623]|uniref:Uncharacterized protein n=1 Tax=Agrobacterium tomkonis CFBP 6623 TaxID=1183432 RepID=A0A1S7PDZ3_9HYPH|nr:exported hypothetical protein [Agrobacterium tomkonis CFBP 6623]